MISEAKLEQDCVTWAKSLGWQSFKFVSPSNRGVPDRIFLRAGETVFVEFKTETGKLSALQHRQIEKLKANDFKVFVIRNLEGFKIAFSR